MDDCLITGSEQKLVDEFKELIKNNHAITDLGPCQWLLGIKVEHNLENHTISLSQHSYINSIISHFNFKDAKPILTQMDPNMPLMKSQSPESLADIAKMKHIPYHEAVGSLMYASMGTRPDIMFAVSTIAQFLENLGMAHWEAVKQVFCYLKGTKDLKLVYGDEEKDLQGWVDAYGASQDHRRAISGYVFMVDGGAVSWSTKKQEPVTLSTTEAEYMAAMHAAKEAIWLQCLFGEFFSHTPISTN